MYREQNFGGNEDEIREPQSEDEEPGGPGDLPQEYPRDVPDIQEVPPTQEEIPDGIEDIDDNDLDKLGWHPKIGNQEIPEA